MTLSKRRFVAAGAAVATGAAMAVLSTVPAGAVVSGAGFTTVNENYDGTGHCQNGNPNVNCNLYDDKNHVWLNGGPISAQPNDGTYFFAVLAPGGQLDPNDGGGKNLSDTTVDPWSAGDTNGDGSDIPIGDTYLDRSFSIASGVITNLGSHIFDSNKINLMPYDDTTNNGGVYIMAVCQYDPATYDPATNPVDPHSCKYDAFKAPTGNGPPPVDNFGVVSGTKYYDANANGVLDPGEVGIANWPIDYSDGLSGTILTDSDGNFSQEFAPDTYTFAEQLANSPWMQTGNTTSQALPETGASVTLHADKTYTVTVTDVAGVSGINFGNLCVGGGGGLTLGFWSNKNGQKLFGADDLALMVSLNLRNANGTNFDPATYAAFKSWLLSASATNMAYMLSAQLAAMELNVLNGFVSSSALIYAPGTSSANPNGFATVSDVMAEGNALLGADGYTVAVGADRTAQEAVKTALDNANNNKNFVQAGPGSCPAPVFPTS